jgi:hemoglobin
MPKLEPAYLEIDMSNCADIASRADIERLVDAFYNLVRADEILGPIFNDVAKVDWPVHLPKMYAFWEALLFGVPGFKGNPLAVHRALAQRTPLTPVEFGRWVEIFHATVDALFAGPVANDAKQRASRIAVVMQQQIAADRTGTIVLQ